MQHNNAGDSSPTPCASSSFPLVDLISRWRLRDRQPPHPHHRSANGLEAGLANAGDHTHIDLEEVTTALPLLRHHRASMVVSSPSSTHEDHSYGLLLGGGSKDLEDEVPYPLPEAFLPLPNKASSAGNAASMASESEGTASKRSWLPLESDEEEEDEEDDAQSIQSYDSDLIKTYDRLSSKVSCTWPAEEYEEEDEQHQTSNGLHARATAVASAVGCAPLLSTFHCLASKNSVDLEDEKLGTIELQQCSLNRDIKTKDLTSRRYFS